MPGACIKKIGLAWTLDCSGLVGKMPFSVAHSILTWDFPAEMGNPLDPPPPPRL